MRPEPTWYHAGVMRLLVILALALTPVLSGAAPREKPTASQVATAPLRAKQAASEKELERYAEREKDSKELENFEGGRISETAIIVILLLLVIIIILV